MSDDWLENAAEWMEDHAGWTGESNVPGRKAMARMRANLLVQHRRGRRGKAKKGRDTNSKRQSR